MISSGSAGSIEPSIEQKLEQAVITPSDDQIVKNRLGALYKEIIERFGENSVSDRESDRRRHGKDFSERYIHSPDLIFYAEGAFQVAWLVKKAKDESFGVIPYGRGRSFEGQAVSHDSRPTVSLDIHRLKKILSLSVEDLTCTVEVGVDWNNLNAQIEKEGLWFPIDPMIPCTIGGLIASNAKGLSCCRFGSMMDNVEAIKVILPNGDVAELTKHMKSLFGLFFGTSGAFGVIVEATLRLQPLVKGPETVIIGFSRFEEASLAVQNLPKQSVIKCFLIDGVCAKTLRLNEYGSTVLLQLGRNALEPEIDPAQIMHLERIKDEDEQRNFWSQLGKLWLKDFGEVPRQNSALTLNLPMRKLCEFLREAKTIPGSHESCFFVSCMTYEAFVTVITPKDPSNNEISPFEDELLGLCLHMKGSCMDCYGPGAMIAPWIKEELGDAGIALMKCIKNAIDPEGILSPNQII